MKKYIVLLLMSLSIMGCGDDPFNIEKEQRMLDENSKRFQQLQNTAINACVKQDGIPILSAWDGRLLNCQFKNK